MNRRELLRHERAALRLEIAVARSAAATAAHDLAWQAGAAVLGVSVARLLAGRSRLGGAIGALTGLLLATRVKSAAGREPAR